MIEILQNIRTGDYKMSKMFIIHRLASCVGVKDIDLYNQRMGNYSEYLGRDSRPCKKCNEIKPNTRAQVIATIMVMNQMNFDFKEMCWGDRGILFPNLSDKEYKEFIDGVD